jgi:hypothetical protein
MKRIIFLLQIVLLLGINGLSQNQEIPDLQFFGTYLLINGQLIELSAENAESLSGSGNIMSAMLGIKSPKGLRSFWINDPNVSIILYGNNRGEKPVFGTLKYQSNMFMAHPITQQQQQVEVNMYILDKEIPVRIAPIEGKQDALHLVPANRLADGFYVLDKTGRIKQTDAFAATREANANNDIWTFVISTDGFNGSATLDKVDVSKGEYTTPPGFGMFLVANNKYIQIPVHRNSEIENFSLDDRNYFGLNKINDIKISADDIQNFFVTYCESDIRGTTLNLAINIGYKSHRDMIPELMFLEKLKQVEVDLRSNRDIRRDRPPKIEKVWVADKTVGTRSLQNRFNNRISKNTMILDLEPGVYAFHNGRLNGENLTFGAQAIFYSFIIE